MLFANDSTYIERQIAYVDAALQNDGGNKMTLQAFRDEPLDAEALESLLSVLPNKYDPDFQIVELIRVLFYADGLYDDDILPVLEEIPMWLNKGDTLRNYWTENHMIMWMSTEWLLHERYDWPVKADLYQRLKYYLELKKEYGFYEFFSSVYFPYTLSGLLNLYEFTEDPVLKEMSMEVAQLLLKDLLKPSTDLGVYFPAAGRCYPEKYESAYGQNHSSLIYLLTGFGEVPSRATHAGAFLATSTLPVDEVIASWTPTLDTLVQVGHSLESSFEINSELSPTDQLVFQWSTGGYAHPLLAEQTFQLLADSSLWDHKDWDALQALSFVIPSDAPELAEELNVISYSSLISGHDVRIFKNNSVALMSTSTLMQGKVGYQQWPFAATVGTTAVFTESGNVESDWSDRDRNVENTHLPKVVQNSNIALVMYRPEPIPSILQLFAGELFADKEVALFWQEDAYDEILEDGNWLLGRQDDNYVAVRRSCTEMLNSWWACPTETGQTWVIVVGDAFMYESFENFQNIIAAAEYSEEWSYDLETSQSTYYAEVMVDTLSAEYSWAIDSVLTSVKGFVQSSGFSIYPNPSADHVNLDFGNGINTPIYIRVFDALGKEIHTAKIDGSTNKFEKIRTTHWRSGIYTILIEIDGEYQYEKLVKF